MATVTMRDRRGRLFQVDLSKPIPVGTRFAFSGMSESYFVVANNPSTTKWPCDIRWSERAREALAPKVCKNGEERVGAPT